MDLSGQLRTSGVVGAGGAGFPACVKAASRAEFLLANGAECEPLIHKDAELMKHFPAAIASGMDLMQRATGATRAALCVKAKNAEALDAMRPHLEQRGMEIAALGDFYPSGDEYEIVYAATGRLIPPAGIPLQVGCVVNNVETLYNVDLAGRGQPVIRKFLSVAGAVREPKTIWAPVGTPFREVIASAGGASVPDPAVFVSGLMMGWLAPDLDEVVTKTTAGLIVLPRDHSLVARRSRSQASMDRIGKSACDQCSYCTEFCPRYLLGYEVMPHKVMRSLGFTLSGEAYWNQWAALCCGCGLCTLYACPEDLYPKEACDAGKLAMRRQGAKFTQQREVRVHPMKESRRVPQALLRKRLHVEEYDVETPYDPAPLAPRRVRIKLSQHAGEPALPVVSAGDAVAAGQVVARVREGALGADIHASIGGKVGAVNGAFIEVRAE